jgi:hypothetical protein
MPLRALVPVLLCLAIGCSGSSRDKPSPASLPPGSAHAASTQATAPALGAPATAVSVSSVVPSPATSPLIAPASVPPGLGRGLRWTRTQPQFVSALSVSMGPPNAAEVDRYFDDFQANAVHLWEDGLPLEIDGWRAANRPDMRWLSWIHSDGTSQTNGLLLGGYPANAPGRIGYQISDEPRSLAQLMAIHQGVNRVRAADPDALLVVNFSHLASDLTAQLDYFVTTMDADVVAYDDYRLGWKAYETLARFRSVGLLAGKPYWRYLYSFIGGHQPVVDESDMRWNAFVGLVYGYTGHTWFLYNAAPAHQLDPAFFPVTGSLGAPTVQFRYAAQINAELENLGRSITQLTSTDVRYVPLISFIRPARTQLWTPGAGNDPYLANVSSSAADLALGFFVDSAGDTYLLAQNVNHRAGTFPVGNRNRTTLTLSFDFAGAPTSIDRDALQTLDRTTGQVRRLSLSQGAAAQRTLTLDLEAGDPVLLKYSTGSPFAFR